MALPIHALLDQVFTVESLMTPWDQLDKVERGCIDEAPVKAQKGHFDLLPVMENGQVIGVWHAEAINFERLTDRWLISRDTPIPYLLTLFIESKRPGFLVLHRQEVVGLVTPADLNKLPARVYVYNLIGELELTLAALIQDQFKTNQVEIIRQKLGEERWQFITQADERLKQENVDVDPVQLLYLSDLVNIICGTENLLARLGLSGTQAKKLGGLVELRDRTMHLVRPLMEKFPKDLIKLHQRLQRIEDVRQRVSV